MVARLSQALIPDNAELAIAASQGQSHPVIGLWSVAVPDALRRALAVEGLRNVGRWTARYRLATVAWAAHPLDPFFNTNTFQDRAWAADETEIRVGETTGGRCNQGHSAGDG